MVKSIWQVGDSDDEADGFAGSPPMTDRMDADGVSTYGEDCLVPEPFKVRANAFTLSVLCGSVFMVSSSPPTGQHH